MRSQIAKIKIRQLPEEGREVQGPKHCVCYNPYEDADPNNKAYNHMFFFSFIRNFPLVLSLLSIL